MRPPAPKAGGDAHAAKENGRCQADMGKVSAIVSPSERKTDVEPPRSSFAEFDISAALLMIERLPLSDSEKAEAVRRLLAGSF